MLWHRDRFFRLSERLTDYNFKIVVVVKMHDLARRDVGDGGDA